MAAKFWLLRDWLGVTVRRCPMFAAARARTCLERAIGASVPFGVGGNGASAPGDTRIIGRAAGEL